jgi:hypothetical protein
MKLIKPVATLIVGTLCWNSTFAAVNAPETKLTSVNVSAEEILSSHGDLRGEITRGLSDPKILSELTKMGVDKKEVEMRLAAMSDQELMQVQKGAERTAGGDVVVVSVTTLLLIAIILILLVR